MPSPTVAIIATTYYPLSHGDVIGTRLLKGYDFEGEQLGPRIKVASMYIEQIQASAEPAHSRDIGVQLCLEAGAEIYPSVAEAIGCGRSGVNVDGVVIIGEHGEYGCNEFCQRLYPRRRLYDTAVATMISAGRFVPIFCDKHLAWSFSDARTMYETSVRLGIPLLAGSSIPLSWRRPQGTEWPSGEKMDAAVALGYGETEDYGFHTLEGLQALAERRRGGESGVASVRAVSGPQALEAVERHEVDPGLFAEALSVCGLSSSDARVARERVDTVFFLDYADGLKASVVLFNDIVTSFAAACRGPHNSVACEFWLDETTFGHFTFLVRQIEALVLNGVAPYPPERTLLTSGVLEAAMRSLRYGGDLQETKPLTFSYRAPNVVSDAGTFLPCPGVDQSS